MVNIKTKFDKHVNDNEKRCKSIIEKQRAKFNQSQIIKQALSSSNLSNNSGKKITFYNEDDDDDDDDDDDNDKNTRQSGRAKSKKHLNKNGKSILFDSSDSEDGNFEFKEKAQFSGKKGFELLNLQSTYGNDERFKIDERFLENEGDDIYENEKKKNYEDLQGEKTKQLKILENVLGTSFIDPRREKKVKKRTYEMIRYDISNKDHEIYEKKIQPEAENLVPSKKKRGNKKTLRFDNEESPKPMVSKDKFYKVSNEVKYHFKEKQNENAQFSLLQIYSVNSVDKNQEVKAKEVEREEEGSIEESVNVKADEFEKVFQEEKQVKVKSEEKEIVLAKGIWKESFFFVQDDVRFKESLEFINKKDSEEATEAAENYNKTRKKLREILRLHIKKQMQNKNPFKNKIGGMNKKQLANSRSKNPTLLFNKRKILKRNHKRRI